MRRPSLRSAAALVAASAGPLLSAAPALGAGPHAPTSPPPATAPATPPRPAGLVAAGHIHLVVQGARGNPPFMIAGRRLSVRGVVQPYVSGQKVKLSVYRDARKVAVKTLAVRALASGAGEVRLGVVSNRPGLVQVRAVHYATAAQAAFSGHGRGVRFAYPNLSGGAQGGSVRVLQSELGALHFVVPQDGVFDEATARAVIAYRKMAGLERVPQTNTRVFELLQRGVGAFAVHYRGDGRHVEADLTRQVLAEIEPGGRVRALYDMSSGKPSTPTVIGRFRVYSKTPGVNSEGMVDSNYFIAGYAIHGYAEVPTFAASHGCLRIPIPDAAAVFSWVQMGTPVDVYNEGGGGSHHVNGHAGP